MLKEKMNLYLVQESTVRGKVKIIFSRKSNNNKFSFSPAANMTFLPPTSTLLILYFMLH